MSSRSYLEQTTELLTHARAMLGDTTSTPEAIFKEVKKAHRLLSTAHGLVRTDKDWRDAALFYRGHADDVLIELIDLGVKGAEDGRLCRPFESLNFGVSYEQIMSGQY